MKLTKIITFSAMFALLFSALVTSFVFAKAENCSLNVELTQIGDGSAELSEEKTHTSSYATRLEIPLNASQISESMVLYPFNKLFNQLQYFQVCVSYTYALPRFVIFLDNDSDSFVDLVLLSDYQMPSDGSWQFMQGGQRWGWTEASLTLDSYGKTWNILNYWKSIYGNATVLSVGVALEYWAVDDSGGPGRVLYADELILNGVTYNIAANPEEPEPTQDVVTYDWSMFRNNLQRSGLSDSPAPVGNLLWKYFTGASSNASLSDRLRATPTIVNGILYMGSNNSNFVALNASTGNLIWQVNVGANVESSAAVADGVVYVGVLWNGYNGFVDAFNATTGNLIWQFAANSGIESSPAVANGLVYVGSYSGYVYALNASTGTLKWVYLSAGMVFSSPAVVDGVVYVGSGDGYVYALNAYTGVRLWVFKAGNMIYSSSAVVDGVVYFNTDNGTAYAVRAVDGTKIWSRNIGCGDHVDSSPAVAYGIAYFGARNGLYALNATNGNQIWFFTSPFSTRQTTGYFYSSPAVAGNVVYFGSCDCILFALDAIDGSIVWFYGTGGFLFSSPAIANGVVYIGSYDGYIYAFGNLENHAALPESTPAPLPSASPSPTTSPNASTTNTTATLQSNEAPSKSEETYLSPKSTEPPAVTNPDQIKTNSIVTGEPRDPQVLDWFVLCGIVVAGIIALVSLVFFYRQ